MLEHPLDFTCCSSIQFFNSEFGFQKFIIVDRFAINLFFISALTLSQIVFIFLMSHHLQSENTSIKFVHHSVFHKPLFYEVLCVMA